jgi:hypothetical protein
MEWHHFHQKIFVNAPIQIIYEAFATCLGMEKWFLRSCIYSRNDKALNKNEYAKAGDSYSFLWHGWPDETNEKGTILFANDIDTFEFTFDGNASTNMVVKISLKSSNEATMVDLYQYNIPDDDASKMNYYVGCKTGWNFYLANMKASFEYGIDLRNKDIGLQDVLNC